MPVGLLSASEWRGGARCAPPYDLSSRRACDTKYPDRFSLRYYFCFEFNSILKLRIVRIFRVSVTLYLLEAARRAVSGTIGSGYIYVFHNYTS